jgi:hypothetical protein
MGNNNDITKRLSNKFIRAFLGDNFGFELKEAITLVNIRGKEKAIKRCDELIKHAEEEDNYRNIKYWHDVKKICLNIKK